MNYILQFILRKKPEPEQKPAPKQPQAMVVREFFVDRHGHFQ